MASEEPAAPPETPANNTRRNLLVLVALAGLAGGGYALYEYLKKPPVVQKPIDPGKATERKSREVPAITFTDVTAASGITFVHEQGLSGHKLLPETMGGGVAVIDYDGDGKPDLLFASGCAWPGHGEAKPALKLYRNLGNWKFEDVTAKVGLAVPLYGMGLCVGDYDNDGRPDVFVSCVGKHRLFRNVNGERFEETTDAAGVGGPGALPKATKDEFDNWKPPIPFGSSATFLDYDGDGKLDLFVCHYVTWSPSIDRGIVSSLVGGKRTYVQPKDMDAAQCALYRNVNGKKFEDVTATAGVLVAEKEGTGASDRVRAVGKSLGVTAWDADGDGFPDLMVANDMTRNFFFHNVPDGKGGRRYEEKGVFLGAAFADGGVPRGGMGIDWCEFAPGRCAAVIANFANEPVTVMEKDAKRLAFSDTALSVGLTGPTRAALKFGTFFFDYDNDGRLDLLVANGHIDPDIQSIQASQSYAQPAQLYWNTGDPECYFEPVPAARGGADLFKPMVSRGSAFADLDGDGDLDVILVANGGPARVLRNDAPASNKSVRLHLHGDGVKSNRSALGAVVQVEAGGKTYTRTVTGGRGYLSQSELVLTVGIGTATKADKVTVRWPGTAGGTEVWTNLDAGKTHELKQGGAK